MPLAIILIGCLELNGAPWWLVGIAGLALIAGRLLHAAGISVAPPDFSQRVLGMKFTFYTLIALVIANIGWALYKLVL